MIGLPWYTGPDEDTFPLYFAMMNYFGALRERTLWRARLGHDAFMRALEDLPPLNETGSDDGLAEPTEEDWQRMGILDIALCNYSRTSLVGKAREIICESALEWGADCLLMWDDDMRFEFSTFLRLWRRQKPVVAALAFTARHPIHPVIFRITHRHDDASGMTVFESSAPVMDYPRDKLITNEDVDGEIAFGAAVMLIDTTVLREVPQPWFTSTGCGEDWFFCHRLMEHGIRRYVDTSIRTQHKAHAPVWCDEDAYWRYRKSIPDAYLHTFGEGVMEYGKPRPDRRDDHMQEPAAAS